MEKLIKTVDEKMGILRVQTTDERWYVRESTNTETGLPQYEFVPSVTWIAEHYPKGIAFYKWLANKGWDEAEAIKVAAGDKGSKVHQAICALIDGNVIKIDDKIPNPTTGADEEITLEEYEAVMSFVAWYKEAKPVIIKREFVVWGDGYAGMVDLLCNIAGQLYLIDLKTSKYIWPSMELQVSAYAHALPKQEGTIKTAILQVGYRLNKKRFKFTEVADNYPEFLAAKTIWAKETKDIVPLQKDYPLQVSLELPKKDVLPIL
jgi:hypothetical protein